MITRRSLAKAVCLLALLGAVAVPTAVAVEPPSAKPDDVARFLAGMEPSPSSPLTPLTRDRAWQYHSRALDLAWAGLEHRRLAKIRGWSNANLADPRQVVFYMFSGPDFLYVDAFFPNRTTYVMSGLEPVGNVPSVDGSSRRPLGYDLAGLREALGSSLNYSFFKTKQMKQTLADARFKGVLPVLYLFLARAGKTIHEVTLIGIDDDGKVVPAGTADAVPGVKIAFSAGDGPQQTLYYVQTDVSDHGLKKTGFLKFCESLGTGDGFIKSASYLLHADSFSTIRNFLLDHTVALVQDDSGIPVRYFKSDEWQLRPFGRYAGPIPLFYSHYQRTLNDVYRKSRPPQLDFGVGYRWRPAESNLLLAVKAAK
jgi:hypothetical protein